LIPYQNWVVEIFLASVISEEEKSCKQEIKQQQIKREQFTGSLRGFNAYIV